MWSFEVSGRARSGEGLVDDGMLKEGLSASNPKLLEAGGPTGTMRDPNSTPIVTSWDGEKRPSQSRTVN